MLNYPFESKNTYILDFLGSCDGLICLKVSSFDHKRGYCPVPIDDYFSILNPLTREYKEFRKPGGGYKATYGFGYDTNIDDYKLVMISDYKGAGCYKIDVYAVKSDSWSSIQGTVNYSFRRGGNESYGVFFNGALHWLGSITTQNTSSEVIICFDIGSETMVNMPLPENIIPPIDYQGIMYANVGVWGDCISVTFIWGSVRIDVWVMQEYAVNKSWIKKFTTTLIRWPGYGIPYWRPLWYYDRGILLVDHCGEQFLLYDPTIGRVSSVPVCDITLGNNRVSYVESISSLNSGKYMEKRITNGIVKNPEPLQLR